jgi:predicted anti-sigma-YlaC factor YlaD
MTHALTCRELTEFVADYLAGQLASERRALFEEHLGECPECHAYLRSYAVTMRLAKNAYDDEPAPAEVPERLVRAILAACRT